MLASTSTAPAPAASSRGAAAPAPAPAAARGAAADKSPERTETECFLKRAWGDVKADPNVKPFLEKNNIKTLEEALESRPLKVKIHAKVGTYLESVFEGLHQKCPCRKCADTGNKTPVL